MYLYNIWKHFFNFVKKWKILLFLIVLGYVLTDLIIGATKDNTGYSPKVFFLLLVICEVVFNIGIVLMLAGSGVFKNWRDIIHFKFENIRFGSKITWVGFHLNRLAALAPFFYLLITGHKYLPLHIIFFIVVDIVVTFTVYFEVRRKINENDHP